MSCRLPAVVKMCLKHEQTLNYGLLLRWSDVDIQGHFSAKHHQMQICRSYDGLIWFSWSPSLVKMVFCHLVVVLSSSLPALPADKCS